MKYPLYPRKFFVIVINEMYVLEREFVAICKFMWNFSLMVSGLSASRSVVSQLVQKLTCVLKLWNKCTLANLLSKRKLWSDTKTLKIHERRNGNSFNIKLQDCNSHHSAKGRPWMIYCKSFCHCHKIYTLSPRFSLGNQS